MCCFHSLSTEGGDSARPVGGQFGRQIRGDKQCHFNNVISYGGVLRLASESQGWGVHLNKTGGIALFMHVQ